MLGLGVLDPGALATKIAHVLALALISGGLLSSLLHLGNPQRAWRALSQWRSSWLSREGVMAIVTFVPLVISAWACVIESRYLAVPGLLGAVLCGVTVYCTAMIYASLRSIDLWHTPLTPTCYLLFGVSGGVLLAGLFAHAGGGPSVWLGAAGLVFLLAAWGAKIAWWRRRLALKPTSTPESATGLGHIGRVRLFERPHINENYLTREMGFQVARKHASKIARLAFAVGGVLPLVLTIAAMGAGNGYLGFVFALMAAAGFVAGVLAERWLFFATARHAVMNYY
jgi:DMSO reductase anchor subunit